MDQDYHRILEVITRFQLVLTRKIGMRLMSCWPINLRWTICSLEEPLCVVSCHEYKVHGNKLCHICGYSTI